MFGASEEIIVRQSKYLFYILQLISKIYNAKIISTIYELKRNSIKEELGRKIANLVKVIGQDELIRRTGGSKKTIEFKLQQPMISIDELK